MSDEVIMQGKVATVHYVGTTPANGEQFDSSRDEGREPISFLVGVGQMIPGFEQEMLGANVGETRDFTLEPERAYGPRDPNGVVQMPKANFGDTPIEEGMMLVAELEDGPAPFSITNIDGDTVTVDFNHRLAGETLHFEVEVMSVRDATDEEQQHGHAHGEHGHGHD